ncbi:hypothetical protein ACTS95_14645 [Empedobacter brevis]|uniref:Peptidase S74 domain-containing protein n=1 Tax=Empedobacter brevis NBRC 14943 = ATCC 43319 TaxID=1218108 RepID=A0A511NI87_9FLAO|nr:hypothetical protein [Empedobacter brevis]GEM52397.1 hypothetical protein EB1_21870 [Empedobacter brevis NBRC 14943 = ATCC 43319]
MSITCYSQYINTRANSTNYNTTLKHYGQVSLGDRNFDNTWSQAALQIGYTTNKHVLFEMRNSLGFLQLAIAEGDQWFSTKAKGGDAIMRVLNGKNFIFNYGSNVSNNSMPGTDGVQRYLFNADNNSDIMSVYNTGKITMGTDMYDLSGYRLFVKDGIKTERLKVEVASANQWADHVFNNDYNLMPLNEVKTFITTNKHLPNIPSAKQIVEDGGIEQGELNAKLLEKIEELTLHLIEQNEKMIQQNKKIEGLEKQVQALTK